MAVEEEFANQLVSMLKSLPIRDLFQEATTGLAPVLLLHQESSQRALRVITKPSPQDNKSISPIISGPATFCDACLEVLHLQGQSMNAMSGLLSKPHIHAGHPCSSQ